MKRLLLVCAAQLLLLLVVFLLGGMKRSPHADRTESLQREFLKYSGARLVFDAGDLPEGRYFDSLPSLSDPRQAQAARICLDEVKKYPPGYLGTIGVKAIGVFAACVMTESDGFHRFDADLQGYRYYGRWCIAGGISAAYYSDRQLPITFHHEIFHQVQATHRGINVGTQYSSGQDLRFREAISGASPYPPPSIRPDDLAALKRIAEGRILDDTVSNYAAKNIREDQAETARRFMNLLPDSLVQVVEQPALPGSQRMLHCLQLYRDSATPGPDVDWFVEVALHRAQQPSSPPR
ncbi:MAG: hypothetical protein K8T91_23660 [Planctomycetes bacterium]|nr:hypothetical protein [Planctomycetota bacterium]